MSEFWQKGDVAMIRGKEGPEVQATWSYTKERGNCWVTVDGDWYFAYQVTPRKLTVIDPGPSPLGADSDRLAENLPSCASCPTCTGPSRETVGLVCQTCGRDFAQSQMQRQNLEVIKDEMKRDLCGNYINEGGA